MLRQVEEQPITVSPIASYCLSSATTNALLMFSKIEYNRVDETRFVGSVAEISDCIDLVMEDVWADEESQLTAWEQLYLGTCVRFYFLHFWEDEKCRWRLADSACLALHKQRACCRRLLSNWTEVIPI